MRITDGTETMEVSVREYGDLSDREITDQTLPSLVEWAETPGIVENVRRTAESGRRRGNRALPLGERSSRP